MFGERTHLNLPSEIMHKQTLTGITIFTVVRKWNSVHSPTQEMQHHQNVVMSFVIQAVPLGFWASRTHDTFQQTRRLFVYKYFQPRHLPSTCFQRASCILYRELIHSCSIRSPSYESACTPQIDPKTVDRAGKRKKKKFERINLLMTGDKVTCNYFLSSEFYNDS